MWRSPIDNYVSCVNHGWCKERDAAKGPLDVCFFVFIFIFFLFLFLFFFCFYFIFCFY